MANTSRPFGFRPAHYLNSAMWNGQHNIYAFSSSETHDTYVGDVVQLDATNRSTGVLDTNSNGVFNGIPCVKPVQAAATTNAIRGIVAGFVPQPLYSMSATASLGTMYRKGSTAYYGYIVDDPFVIFEVEEVGNSYTSASNNGVNKVVDVTYTAGSTTTGIGNTQIDATTVVTNAVKPFRIFRYTQRVDNFGFTSSDTNSRAKLDVLMNNSDLFGAATGTITGA